MKSAGEVAGELRELELVKLEAGDGQREEWEGEDTSLNVVPEK